jgi:hypothetical protein
MRRYLVTGSRDWSPEAVMDEVFRRLAQTYRADEITIVHGDCPTGVDALADRLAKRWGFKVEKHQADWNNYGTRAGPMRNTRMVKAGAVMCFAFSRDINKSRGTRDCAGKAVAHGIHTMLFFGDTYEQVRQFGPSEIDR